ncbi:MAG: HD domain-containing protein [Solirubrobacteraceae bacterium]|nr:HD domain-containing protein [Solirubrobacteraceae bacterium]
MAAIDDARTFPLSEILGALTHALDITEGQPPGHALRSCLIGMRIAEVVGLPEEDRAALFYALLMKDAGCSANASRMAAIFSADDHELKRSSKLVNTSEKKRERRWAISSAGAGAGLTGRLRAIVDLARTGEFANDLIAARCERGAEIARMLALPEPAAEAIRALDEHWDGNGRPRGLKGDEIPLLGRILGLAQTVEVFSAIAGPYDAIEVAVARRGTWFDPELVDALTSLPIGDHLWAQLADENVESHVALREPGEVHLQADAAQIDRICEAFARVIDAKSPFTFNHSARVTDVAVGIAGQRGITGQRLRRLRRAALLHDIGKLAVSNQVLDKPGKLDADEFAQIKRHPEQTLAILSRAACFAPIAELAANHHEKLDGSGYHRGLTGDVLTEDMRILAVADIYEALTADRPYRDGMPIEKALSIIGGDIPVKLCSDAYAGLEAWIATDDRAVHPSRTRALAAVPDPIDLPRAA